jgi:tetrahydromethanopterin S-methyltransferase subunit G
MKKLIKALLVVAVLNLIAVLLGVGWVFASGRVDTQRVTQVVDMFSETTQARDQRIKAEEAEAAAELVNKEKDLPKLAMNSNELNDVRLQLTQIDRARLERMQREINDLQNTLKRERALLASERTDFQEERSEFKAMRERLKEIEGSDQFSKSLKVLKNMKPSDAKEMLSVLIDEGKWEQVVSYLSALGGGITTDVLTEFIKAGEAELAAGLLESIRMRGQETALTDASTDDDTPDQLNP